MEAGTVMEDITDFMIHSTILSMTLIMEEVLDLVLGSEMLFIALRLSTEEDIIM